jgi:hypothetical protein
MLIHILQLYTPSFQSESLSVIDEYVVHLFALGYENVSTPFVNQLHVHVTIDTFGALQVASTHIHHSHLHVQLYSPSFQFGSLFTIDDDLVHKLFADGYTVVATQLVDALHCASA